MLKIKYKQDDRSISIPNMPLASVIEKMYSKQYKLEGYNTHVHQILNQFVKNFKNLTFQNIFE